MPDISLTFAAGSTARLQPVLNGNVRPEGIELQPQVQRVTDIFWSMPLTEPYDVSEMSLTGYLWAIQHGRRWIALPVFPAWVFGCHADTLVNVHAGIERPADLRGKRVGVPEYPVTAIAWIRDAWEQEAGLRRQDVVWCEERTEKTSHYRPLGYRPPATVPLESVPESKCLCDMLIAGEVDAVTRYFGGPHAKDPSTIDRSALTMDELAAHPNVRWLYPDRKAAATAYSEKVGSPQPIHCIIVKQDVVDRYPWVPQSLHAAFAEAARQTDDVSTVRPSFDFPRSEERRVVGPDFSPVGLSKRNRNVLARLLDLAAEDGFIVGDRRFSVEELFHESTLADS